MKKDRTIRYEIFLALIIAALILLPQLIGSTTVNDDSEGVDENGCPVTSTALEDLESPGTRFGVLTIHEWEMEVRKRFPEGEVFLYDSMANCYEALDTGKVDACRDLRRQYRDGVCRIEGTLTNQEEKIEKA